MSVAKKLKWKRALSRLRFCYDELEYTKESAKAAGPEFEAFYRKFCAERNIDISKLEYLKISKNAEKYASTIPYITAHQDPSIVEIFKEERIKLVCLFLSNI